MVLRKKCEIIIWQKRQSLTCIRSMSGEGGEGEGVEQEVVSVNGDDISLPV